MTPSVTVLMALYNGGPYLASSVKSILDQTYKDFEFLIIDDCSTDDSVKVIESFQDPRVHIHHNQQNLGQTKSLNVGLRLAKGHWIARMDADDVALAHWLERQAAFINANPDFAVVSADALVIDKEGRVKSKYLVPSKRDDIILRSFFKSPINHVGSVINKRIALELGGYDEKYRTVAVYDLWRKMIVGGYKMTSLGKTCMAIRRYEESLSYQDLGDKYFRQIAEIVRPIIEAHASVNVDDQKLCLLLRSLYTPKGMTLQEFDEALHYLKHISTRVIAGKFSEPGSVKSWSARFMRELILKRIQSLISQKDYGLVRQSACYGMQELGVSSVLLWFYLASFFGGIFLSAVPGAYAAFARYRALPGVRFP